MSDAMELTDTSEPLGVSCVPTPYARAKNIVLCVVNSKAVNIALAW